MTKPIVILVIALIVSLSSLAEAQYLDPGTGSYIYQILIAGLALFIFYFSRIKGFVGTLFRKTLKNRHPQ